MTALLALAGSAMAAGPACKTNFKQEGKFMTARTFTTWDVVTGVNVSTAYKRILPKAPSRACAWLPATKRPV